MLACRSGSQAHPAALLSVGKILKLCVEKTTTPSPSMTMVDSAPFSGTESCNVSDHKPDFIAILNEDPLHSTVKSPSVFPVTQVAVNFKTQIPDEKSSPALSKTQSSDKEDSPKTTCTGTRTQSIPECQKTLNSHKSSKQTDLLSFLSKHERSPNKHTPPSQHSNMDLSISASRELFPLTPSRLDQNKPRKRKLPDECTVKPTKRRRKENMDQLQLDCGQKLFGHVTCKVCGMVYTHNQLDDQAEHSKFHTRFVTGVYFPGWKKETVVATFEFGRIIMVLPSDAKQHIKKMKDIQQLVDHELGYSISPHQTRRQFTVFLCVSHKKKIMGCVFTERINEGYEVLTDESLSFDSLSAWFCSSEPQSAVLGINRLWVSGNCRRKGLATKLVDAARYNLVPGSVIPKDKIAFTDPTPDGKQFAAHYCQQTNFLVYR